MIKYMNDLIDYHKRRFESYEKPHFDKARQYYRGEFPAGPNAISIGKDSSADQRYRCTKNLTYAIADTAISSLLGPSIAVGARPRNIPAQDSAPAVTGLMEYVFKQNHMRRRAANSMINATLCKRGIFKTTWSSTRSSPEIASIDPYRLFFDLSVTDVDYCGYWLEATVVPFSQLRKKFDAGLYSTVALDQIKADKHPAWLMDRGTEAEQMPLHNVRKWALVWEYYDLHDEKVYHYIPQARAVVLEDDLTYAPYSMYSLNMSGVDCSGLSEIQLILSQQETVNDMLSLLKEAAYLMIPRMMYNAGQITGEELNRAINTKLGSFVPITPKQPDLVHDLRNLFAEFPQVQHPDGVFRLLERMEMDASYVSALVEAARGRFVGARTATEMAVIDAHNKSRLSTREGHVNEAIEDVAAKSFYLCQKHLSRDQLVEVSGDERFIKLDIATLREAAVNFEMISYNPIRRNPAVMAETLVQMIPLLHNAPNVDVVRMYEDVIGTLGLSHRIVIPEEKAKKQMAAAAQAETLRSMGGAAMAQGAQLPQVAPNGQQQKGEAPKEAPLVQQQATGSSKIIPRQVLLEE